MAVLRQATLADLFSHLAAKKTPLLRRDYACLVDETLAGRVLAAGGSAGVPAVIGGIFLPGPPRPGTCWFSVVPGAFCSGGLPPLVLALRRFVRQCAAEVPEGLAAYVLDDNAAGARLAHAIGFRPSGVSVGTIRQWGLAWTPSPVRQQSGNST